MVAAFVASPSQPLTPHWAAEGGVVVVVFVVVVVVVVGGVVKVIFVAGVV